MDALHISQVRSMLCPENDDNFAYNDIEMYNWVGIAMFVVSEILSYMDVEANGVLQAIIGLFKPTKKKDQNEE